MISSYVNNSLSSLNNLSYSYFYTYSSSFFISLINSSIFFNYYIINCKGSFGGCQGQPSARPWHLLIAPLGLQPFPPHRFVSVLRLLPTLITISSSSINSPVTHARLACSLPYTWAILPYNYLF